eukprot:8105492-Alexandrium_andersonii.AAC.1
MSANEEMHRARGNPGTGRPAIVASRAAASPLPHTSAAPTGGSGARASSTAPASPGLARAV